MIEMSLIRATGISKAVNDELVLDSIDITIEKGRITGIIGEDGKQIYVLFAVLSNAYLPDSGTVHRSSDLASNPLFHVRQNLMADPTSTCSKFYKEIASNYPYHDDGMFEDLCNEYGIPLNAKVNMLASPAKGLFQLIVGMSCRPSLLIVQDPLADVDDLTYESVIDHLERLNKEGTSILISSPSAEELNEYCHDVIDLREEEIQTDVSDMQSDCSETPDRFEFSKAPWLILLSFVPFITSFSFIEVPSNLLSISIGCNILMATFFMSDIQITYGQDIRKVNRGISRTSIELHRCMLIILSFVLAIVLETTFYLFSGMSREAITTGIALSMVFLLITLIRHRLMLSYEPRIVIAVFIIHYFLLFVHIAFLVIEPEILTFDGASSVLITAICVVLSILILRNCIEYYKTKDLEPDRYQIGWI